MIVYRCSASFPFLWEGGAQPPARWHGVGEGPAHYFADTPDGAWAEFVRHENITDPADLEGVRETLWAIEIPDELAFHTPALPNATLTGNESSYPACQADARAARARGATGLRVTSAALLPDGARGWRVEDGIRDAAPRDGRSLVLFGLRPNLVGWRTCSEGRPADHLLTRVRYLR